MWHPPCSLLSRLLTYAYLGAHQSWLLDGGKKLTAMASTTQIYYLERLKLFETEKPYMVTFDLPPGVGLKTNHVYVPHQVSVCDAQSQKDEFSLDIHGFQFHTWETSLQGSEDFDNSELVKSKYYPETVAHMERIFPNALEIHALTHLVSRTLQVLSTHLQWADLQ